MTELWMLDLDEHGKDPWQAHLVVEDHGDYRLMACGERGMPGSFKGWWTTEDGDLPLSGPNAIHCGRTPEQVVAYGAAKGWAQTDEQLPYLLGMKHRPA